MLGTFTGHGLQIPFPHYQVGLAAHLDLELLLRAEQHPVAHLHRPNVMSDSKDFSPRQTPGYLCCRRDNDAAAASTLTFFAQQPDQHTVVQHLNLELAVGHGERVRAAGAAVRSALAPGPGRTGRAARNVESPATLPGRGSDSITGLSLSSLRVAVPLQLHAHLPRFTRSV